MQIGPVMVIDNLAQNPRGEEGGVKMAVGGVSVVPQIENGDKFYEFQFVKKGLNYIWKLQVGAD